MCTPLKFTPNRADGLVSISIEFTNSTDTELFKDEIDSAKKSKNHSILIASRRQRMLLLKGENSISLVTKATMARACWYRLTAEGEMAADEVCSLSAKHTMRIVAETWDRPAENTERTPSDIGSSGSPDPAQAKGI